MKTEHIPEPFPVHLQIQTLLDYGLPTTSKPSIRKLAEAIGISSQTCANLIQGNSENPRLSTLLGLSRYFGVSLDYFMCSSAGECRAYLYRHRLRSTSALVAEIESTAIRLSHSGQRNVLTVMEWMQLASHD